MLLSIELCALQNQIAKRTSATKSITVRSGYGPDILAGFILFFSNMILGNWFHHKRSSLKNLLITLIEGKTAGLIRGKILRYAETSWAKFCGRPYLCKIFVLTEQVKRPRSFFRYFVRVLFACRNVLSVTFLPYEIKKLCIDIYCGGRLLTRTVSKLLW